MGRETARYACAGPALSTVNLSAGSTSSHVVIYVGDLVVVVVVVECYCFLIIIIVGERNRGLCILPQQNAYFCLFY